MNKRLRRMLSGGLALLLCMGVTQPVYATEIEDAQKKAEELENQKDSAEEERDSLSSQLNSILEEMAEAEKNLSAKQEEIKDAEDELVQAKVDEDNQYQSMKKRIKYMYENGNSHLFEILAQSESIGDFLNKAEYVSQISSYDREMLVEFQGIVTDVQEKEEALQAEYTELEDLQDTLIAKQTEVQSMLDSKNLQLADLEQQIGENAATLQELIAQAEAEAEKQRQAAEAAAAAAAAASTVTASTGNSGGGNSSAGGSSGGSASYAPGSSGTVVSGSGYFSNPCPSGYVSSPFGPRDYGGYHYGLDLAAPQGTPTYAADSGTVVIAGWSDSAGNWVVINHGNGFVTKYMHHSALCVTAGQYVQRGQQIGYVGNTGDSFGAHLHFQVELNGTRVDPQLYL
jgi:murein DD-endopeptidase MepM/ murein hydrolase activator NlpD